MFRFGPRIVQIIPSIGCRDGRRSHLQTRHQDPRPQTPDAMACPNCAALQHQLQLAQNAREHEREARETAEALVQTLLAQLAAANSRLDSANAAANARAADHEAALERLSRENAAAMERLSRENAAAMERQTVLHRDEVVRRVDQLRNDTRRLFTPFANIQAAHKRMRGTSFTGLASDDQEYVILADDADDPASVSFKLRYGQRKHVRVYRNDRQLGPPSMTGSGASLRAFVTRGLRQDFRDDPALVSGVSSITSCSRLMV